MANKLGMTAEQEQRFLAPIIKFIQQNPNLFKSTGGERNEVRTAGITAGLGVGEITIEQNPKLQAKSKARSTDGTLAS